MTFLITYQQLLDEQFVAPLVKSHISLTFPVIVQGAARVQPDGGGALL